MCDFSEYGGPSEEWLAVEKTLPGIAFDTSKDINELKAIINSGREDVSALAMKSLGPKVKTETYDIPTRDGSSIQARSYRSTEKVNEKDLPVYLYFHGGGFVFGTLDSEDAACSNLAINTGVVVLNVNYRHTPEFKFPVAWNDAQDAFVWLHSHTADLGVDPAKVVVGGISAGGQLTASLVLEKHLGNNEALEGLPEIAGQVLIIPCVANLDTYADGPLKKMKSPEVSSYVENENAPILPRLVVEWFSAFLKTETPELKDTKLNIVNYSKEEVKGLPPTAFGIAGLDPLRDEGLLYAKLLTEAGVPTDIRLFKGVPHGHRRFGAALKASAEWDRCIEEGIWWTLGKPEASGKFDVKVV